MCPCQCGYQWIGAYDDVIKWKHFPRNWPFVRGIHRSPVNSTHKGQWRGALMFSLICFWINDWVNNLEAGDLRRYRLHYDVIVMSSQKWLKGCLCHFFMNHAISILLLITLLIVCHASTGQINDFQICFFFFFFSNSWAMFHLLGLGYSSLAYEQELTVQKGGFSLLWKTVVLWQACQFHPKVP